MKSLFNLTDATCTTYVLVPCESPMHSPAVPSSPSPFLLIHPSWVTSRLKHCLLAFIWPAAMVSPCDTHTSARMTVTCWGDGDMLCRPCVDCGRFTGNFCENDCLAASRIPTERWAGGQRTPHCTHCERRYGVCHFCRQQSWVQPPPLRGQPPRSDALGHCVASSTGVRC